MIVRLGEGTSLAPSGAAVARGVLGLAVIAGGGALTGYLVAGRRGVAAGALAHLALFGLANAIMPSSTTTAWRVGYAGLALGAGVWLGYLRQRRSS